MPSKQFAHLQQSSLQQLKSLIPAGCPLVVCLAHPSGFEAFTLDHRDHLSGRFQVVHAFITGYVACWQRGRPRVEAIGQLLTPHDPRCTCNDCYRAASVRRRLRQDKRGGST